MKNLLYLASTILILSAFSACAPSGSQSSQVDADLATIRSGYVECVNDLGADAAQCKTLADGLHSVAEQIGSAQNTAGRIKAENEARRSMGY
jgi:hypothetical protein